MVKRFILSGHIHDEHIPTPGQLEVLKKELGWNELTLGERVMWLTEGINWNE
jgi:hypothetical protein